MVNVDKIKALAKYKGISVTYLCQQFGMGRGYLNDVAKAGGKMPDDRIRKIAEALDTSYDYLTDQTDDPAPHTDVLSSEEKTIVNHMVEVLREVDEEQREILTNVLLLPSDKLTHIMQGINLIRNA